MLNWRLQNIGQHSSGLRRDARVHLLCAVHGCWERLDGFDEIDSKQRSSPVICIFLFFFHALSLNLLEHRLFCEDCQDFLALGVLHSIVFWKLMSHESDYLNLSCTKTKHWKNWVWVWMCVSVCVWDIVSGFSVKRCVVVFKHAGTINWIPVDACAAGAAVCVCGVRRLTDGLLWQLI